MNLYKYKIIEYEVKKMTESDIEYAKVIHNTNSKLLYLLIKLCFKINHIKYDVVIRED